MKKIMFIALLLLFTADNSTAAITIQVESSLYYGYCMAGPIREPEPPIGTTRCEPVCACRNSRLTTICHWEWVCN
jgi:hypothetical protein